MNKLEEAAREYASCEVSEGGLDGLRGIEAGKIEPFIAGAQWQSKQSPWISVKEQLPEENLINPSAWSVTYKVFVLTSNGNASISQRRWNCNTNRWEWKGSGAFKDSITHWMPIPE